MLLECDIARRKLSDFHLLIVFSRWHLSISLFSTAFGLGQECIRRRLGYVIGFDAKL